MESIDTRIANNVLGDVPVRTVFSGYKDYSGIKFPSRIVQTQAGHPTLELNVSDVQPNSTAANELSVSGPPPAAPPSSPVKTEPQKIADGIWFLDGGAPMSVLVEFSDHVVIIEAPQNDERTEATIAAVKQLAAVEADSLRRQHASALRSLRRGARLRRGGHSRS